MKKYRFFVPFIVAMAVLPCFSCKTTPATETPPAASDKPAAVTSAELTAAIARAEEARQKVVDFEGPSYFPSEFDAAEEKYTHAKHTAQNAEAVRMSVEAYNDTADAFDALFKLTIPLYAQAKEDEIMKLRDELIAAGVRDAEPNYFAAADETALSAYNQYEAEEYYPARDTANKSIMMYQTLENSYEALLAKTEIEEMDFVSYDPDNYERAGNILSDAMDAYEGGDINTAYENSNEALERYNEVLIVGWTAYAEYRSSLAESERQAALDIKANIATKDLFSQAESSYKAGKDAYSSKQFKEAAQQFMNSESLFMVASTTAMEKRQVASETIKEANDKIEESAETARKAEVILEGGAK